MLCGSQRGGRGDQILDRACPATRSCPARELTPNCSRPVVFGGSARKNRDHAIQTPGRLVDLSARPAMRRRDRTLARPPVATSARASMTMLPGPVSKAITSSSAAPAECT